MKFRLAVPEDAAALLPVYGEYIHTTVTFEEKLPSTEEFAARIEKFTAVYPWLIAEREDGSAAGYAYAHRLAERAAYGWSTELSVYISADDTGAGLGRRLYGALLELLAMQGVHYACAKITVPNERSTRLHSAMGFAHVGTQHRVGFKNGRWLDLLIYEKEVVPCDSAPSPLKTIAQLDGGAVAAVLRKYGEGTVG